MPSVSSRTHVGIVDGEAEHLVTIDEVVSHLGAEGLIRLRSHDFGLLNATGSNFVHFNLGETLNQVEMRYALVPIIVPGRRILGEPEILPVVNPRQFRIATCRTVRQRVSLDLVTAEEFSCSLPTIRNVDQLRKALFSRYVDVTPGLTLAHIDEHGCAISRLEMDTSTYSSI